MGGLDSSYRSSSSMQWPKSRSNDPGQVNFHARALAALVLAMLPCKGAGADPPFGLERRVPWTSSRLIGSPDPPLPYTVSKTFTNLEWKAPIYIAPEPGTDFLLVVLAGGEPDQPSKILRIKDDPATGKSEPFLEVERRLVYAVSFHPGYEQDGFMFLFTNGNTGETERGNRISRFVVDR